jgi:hypothetical protein
MTTHSRKQFQYGVIGATRFTSGDKCSRNSRKCFPGQVSSHAAGELQEYL